MRVVGTKGGERKDKGKGEGREGKGGTARGG